MIQCLLCLPSYDTNDVDSAHKQSYVIQNVRIPTPSPCKSLTSKKYRSVHYCELLMSMVLTRVAVKEGGGDSILHLIVYA